MLPRCLVIILAIACISGWESVRAAVTFQRGDTIRLIRGEMLQFQGKNLAGAAKGQEFAVLQHDLRSGLIYVPFVKDDGSLVAGNIPAAAAEPAPRNGWNDLLAGAEAFRDGRWEDARRLLARATQDPGYAAQAATIAARVNGAVAAAGQAGRSPAARPAFANAMQGLRDLAEQLSKSGQLSVALPLDEGTDRLGTQVLGAGAVLPATKLDRAALTPKVAAANRTVHRARQSAALHRLADAAKNVTEGLAAEPNRPELKALQQAIEKDIAEADSRFADADRMKRFEKGAIHALTAIEMGLKRCSDHPKLLALKKEMQSAFEERTAPPVTSAFLSAARASASKAILEEGHKLYTTRCTECHDLELIDSRSVASWRTAVAGMAGRAKLTDAQQARIMEYIAAAQTQLDAGQ